MMKPPGHVQAVINDLTARGYAVHVRSMRTGSLRYTLSGGREMTAQQLLARYDAMRKAQAELKSEQKP